MDLGARPWQVFWLVTLPMIAQALLSAWLLTFTLSLDDVVLSAFLSGPGATTMPLVIFSRARLGLNPSVNAVATIIVAVVAIGVVVASFVIARNERRRAARRRPTAARAERPACTPRPRASGSPTSAWPRHGDRRRLRRLLEGARRRLPGLPARLAALRHRRRRDGAAGCAGRPASPARRAHDHRLLFVESFFGNFLFSICMLFGVRRASALAAGVIMAALPAVVAILSRLLLDERIAPRVPAASPAPVAGIALVALRARRRGERRAARCAATRCCFGAVVCEALYVVIGKRLTGVVSARSGSARSSTCGASRWSTPLGALAGLRSTFDVGRPSRRGGCCSPIRSPPASITVWLWMTGLRTCRRRRPASSRCCCRSARPRSASFFSASAFARRRRSRSRSRSPASCWPGRGRRRPPIGPGGPPRQVAPSSASTPSGTRAHGPSPALALQAMVRPDLAPAPRARLAVAQARACGATRGSTARRRRRGAPCSRPSPPRRHRAARRRAGAAEEALVPRRHRPRAGGRPRARSSRRRRAPRWRAICAVARRCRR